MISEIPLFLLFISFITLFFLVRKNVHTRRLPPGPKRLPIIGNLHQLRNFSHRSLRDLSQKFGDLMYLQLGSVPVLVVSSPDMARVIFKNHDLIFSGMPNLYALSRLTYNNASVTSAPYGELWRELRKIMVLELMTVKRVQSFAHIRDQEVAHMIQRIASISPNPIDLSSLAFSLSNNIISRVAFGETNPVNVDGIGFHETFIELQCLAVEMNIADLFPSLAWVNWLNGVDKRIEKNNRKMDMFIDALIERHADPKRPKPEYEDLVDVLLRIRKDEMPKGLLMDVFMAGTDTTSTTIEWTMSELMRNPKVIEKATQEVRQIGKGKTRIEEDDLPNLMYLKQVLKESFRLHPPVPLPFRETTEKCTINNKYEIPAKTQVFINEFAISTDPKHWEDAEKFFPERFTDNHNDYYKGQSFEMMPFGGGRRICPGINFAIPVVELALANLLFFFDWELPNGMLATDIDMSEAVGITVHRKKPLCLVAKPMNQVFREADYVADGLAGLGMFGDFEDVWELPRQIRAMLALDLEGLPHLLF